MMFFEILPFLYLISALFFVVLMILGQLIIFNIIKSTKFKATLGTTMAICVFAYLMFSFLLSVYSLFQNDYFSFILYFAFFVSPFAIGVFCSYKKIAFFSLAQICILFFNIAFLIWKFGEQKNFFDIL